MVGAALRQVFAEGASHSAADLEVEAYAAFIELNREHARAIEFGGPSHGASALIKTGGSLARAAGGRPKDCRTFAYRTILYPALCSRSSSRRGRFCCWSASRDLAMRGRRES